MKYLDPKKMYDCTMEILEIARRNRLGEVESENIVRQFNELAYELDIDQALRFAKRRIEREAGDADSRAKSDLIKFAAQRAQGASVGRPKKSDSGNTIALQRGASSKTQAQRDFVAFAAERARRAGGR